MLFNSKDIKSFLKVLEEPQSYIRKDVEVSYAYIEIAFVTEESIDYTKCNNGGCYETAKVFIMELNDNEKNVIIYDYIDNCYGSDYLENKKNARREALRIREITV